MVKGRRRIGKSRLAEEYGKSFDRAVILTGLPPSPGITVRDQRLDFARQLARRFDIPVPPMEDWGDLFWTLAQQVQNGSVLVVLDEVSWLAGSDPTFLPKLKTAWDQDFKRNPRLVLLVSGSMSTWIDDNLLSNTGFVGRVSLELTLDELPLHECVQFWHPQDELISAHEKLRMLAVTGGVPRYLEEILPHEETVATIRRICFTSSGLLFHEFERLFSDLFNRRAKTYRSMVERLAQGRAMMDDICDAMGVKKGGNISAYLDELVRTGFVARDNTWNLQTGRPSRLGTFRLRDNYVRFYLKYIAPNRQRILAGTYRGPPAWPGVFGLQLENLLLNNRDRLHRDLGIDPSEIVCANPYLQRPTRRQRGCQVDYLVQTRFGTLYVVELKSSKTTLGVKVIQQMQDKIDRLAAPRHMSFRPVLVHLNGVSDTVLEQEYFAHIVDLTTFLRP